MSWVPASQRQQDIMSRYSLDATGESSTPLRSTSMGPSHMGTAIHPSAGNTERRRCTRSTLLAQPQPDTGFPSLTHGYSSGEAWSHRDHRIVHSGGYVGVHDSDAGSRGNDDRFTSSQYTSMSTQAHAGDVYSYDGWANAEHGVVGSTSASRDAQRPTCINCQRHGVRCDLIQGDLVCRRCRSHGYVCQFEDTQSGLGSGQFSGHAYSLAGYQRPQADPSFAPTTSHPTCYNTEPPYAPTQYSQDYITSRPESYRENRESGDEEDSGFPPDPNPVSPGRHEDLVKGNERPHPRPRPRPKPQYTTVVGDGEAAQ